MTTTDGNFKSTTPSQLPIHKIFVCDSYKFCARLAFLTALRISVAFFWDTQRKILSQTK